MKYIKKESVAKLEPIHGSVTDTMNVEDKITNAPSLRVVNNLIGAPIDSVIAYDGDDIPEGYEETDFFIPDVTTTQAGLMSASDKSKLDGIASGAQVNPGVATTTQAGLMSAEDKVKMNYLSSNRLYPININADKNKNTSPSDYLTKDDESRQGLWFIGLKYCSALGISTSVTYCQLYGSSSWSDTSGGYPCEIAIVAGSGILYRFATSDIEWGPWYTICPIQRTATTTYDGLMTVADKIKLNGIEFEHSDGDQLYVCRTPYGGQDVKHTYGAGLRVGKGSFGNPATGKDTYWLTWDLHGRLYIGDQINIATNPTWTGAIMEPRGSSRVKWLTWKEPGSLQFQIDNSIMTIALTTSDERLKTDIQDIDDNLLNAVGEIKLKQFKIDTPLSNKKISFGIIAQQAVAIFEKYGLDINDYDLIYQSKTFEDDDIEYYSVKYEQWSILRQAWLERELMNK